MQLPIKFLLFQNTAPCLLTFVGVVDPNSIFELDTHNILFENSILNGAQILAKDCDWIWEKVHNSQIWLI